MQFDFQITTKIFFKTGGLDVCQNEIEKILPKNSKVMLCLGKGSARKYGYFDRLLKQLENYDVVLFEGIQANPLVSKAEEGLNLARKENVCAVIALGGGSVMDTAKPIALGLTNDCSIDDLWNYAKKTLQKSVPLIMIPTTPATSSEINEYAVLTNESDEKKGFGYAPQMFPDLAIIDPELTLSMPESEIKASLGDILAHSLEAAWSKRGNEFTNYFAGEAIKLILENGVNVVKNPTDLKLREKISLASVFAGMAFAHTGTTVSHAISYPLTIFHGVTHGLGCAITLPLFYKYFGEKTDFADLNKVLNVVNAKEGSEKLEEFLKNVGIQTRFSEWGINENSLKRIAENAFPYKNDVNPVEIKQKEMESLLKGIL